MASLGTRIRGAHSLSRNQQRMSNPDTQFLTFPGFFFPVAADITQPVQAAQAAFDFTHWVNMAPGKPPLSS